MSILKLQVITSLFVVLFSGHVLADAVCDECMDQKAKDQTISLNSSVNDVIAVAGKVDPYSSESMTDLCNSVRELRLSSVDSNFYDFEYKLLKLAGITDPYKMTEDELKAVMKKLWDKHSKDFECKFETSIYPRGNYFRQLARSDSEDAFELLLDNYSFNPNIIDQDGCTALDYIEIQIRRTIRYNQTQIQTFKKFKKTILEYGAKHANQLGGKCDILTSYSS